jgi:hypothetical protein
MYHIDYAYFMTEGGYDKDESGEGGFEGDDMLMGRFCG